MRDLTFAEAQAKAEHLKALGQTQVYLRDASENFPWDRATTVESGGMHRMSGPISAWIVADVDGIEYRWSVNFEDRDADGRNVAMFDEEHLREVMMKLPSAARTAFASMLRKSVLSPLSEHTENLRKALAGC